MDFTNKQPMHPELKRLFEIEQKMKDLEYYKPPSQVIRSSRLKYFEEKKYVDMEIKDIQQELMCLYGYDDELFLKVAKILKYPNGNIDEKVPTAKEAKNFFKKMVKKQEASK